VAKWLLAIRLVCLKKSTEEVGKAIAVSAAQVRRWVNRFHRGGIEAMRPCWSSGRTPKLTAEQMDRVRERIGRPDTSGRICLARSVPQPETRTAAFFQRQTVTPWSGTWPIFRVASMTASMPYTVTRQFLPAKSPERNPAEQPWREIRQKYPGNRVFATVEEVDYAIADARMQPIKNKNAIQSLCAYDWIMNITQKERKMV
jgi:hypothetical protein